MAMKSMSVTKHKNKFGKLRNCLNHVLVCGFHAKDENNLNLFEEYKSRGGGCWNAKMTLNVCN